MSRRDLLDEEGLAEGLAEVDWLRDGDAITRTVKLSSFAAAIEFVRQVAAIAEAMDHHPDIDIRYRTVTLRVSTHSSGGLTPMDFELARAVDALVPTS